MEYKRQKDGYYSTVCAGPFFCIFGGAFFGGFEPRASATGSRLLTTVLVLAQVHFLGA